MINSFIEKMKMPNCAKMNISWVQYIWSWYLWPLVMFKLHWNNSVPVACRRSWKNLWLKMKATPLISSTLASAVVLRLMKFAVTAMASFPRNSFLRNPTGHRQIKPLHRSFENNEVVIWTCPKQGKIRIGELSVIDDCVSGAISYDSN